MLSLNELGYEVAVQGEISSDKNVIISLVLPHDKFDENTKREVQQFAMLDFHVQFSLQTE